MPGLRRLRDVGSKISGALSAPRAEGDERADDDAAPPASEETPPVTAEQADGPGAPEPVEAEAPEHDVPPPAPADPPAEPAVEAPAEPAAAAPGERPLEPAVEPTVAAEPDPVCAAAVEPARAAAVEVAAEVGPDVVGEHLGAEAEPARDGELVVTHSFAAQQAGYRGWRWAVTVARAPGTDDVTVDEVVLLPGSEALLAPAWVPWSERVQPDDLGPGDVLPPAPDDPRLVPSYEDVDAEELPFDLHRDLGLGRRRVLSAEGRELAAERWFDGEQGPFSPRAKAAPGRCGDCGFLVPVAGRLGRTFGVCANALAPDDGRVVALLHGCGAHSETVSTSAHASTTELVVEHEELELVPTDALPES